MPSLYRHGVWEILRLLSYNRPSNFLAELKGTTLDKMKQTLKSILFLSRHHIHFHRFDQILRSKLVIRLKKAGD